MNRALPLIPLLLLAAACRSQPEPPPETLTPAAQACALPDRITPAGPEAPDPDEVVADAEVAYYMLAVAWGPYWQEGNRDGRGYALTPQDREVGWFLHGLWPNAAEGDHPRYCSVTPALIHYILLVSGACIVTVILSYPLAMMGGVSLARFARALVPVQAVAFSTQSSLGTLPVMVERAQDFLGIPERVAGLVLPLAVAIFRITSPVANLSVALFIAHVSGLEPSVGQMAAAGVVALAVSIGTVGLPGQVSFFASMAPICLALGVPLELLPLLLAVEVIPDIFRTLGNVSADMAVTVVLDDSEPEEAAAAAA